MEILFFTEEIDFYIENEDGIREWLQKVAADNHYHIGVLNFIITDDNNILKVNTKFLSHNYLTDIITFNYCQGKELNGDVYISVDRVKENAAKFSSNFNDEFYRVIVHGVLHLIGFDDHNEPDRKLMRHTEDKYLSLLADL